MYDACLSLPRGIELRALDPLEHFLVFDGTFGPANAADMRELRRPDNVARNAQHARREYVARQRLHLVRKRDWVLAVGELFQLAAVLAENRIVDGQVVAIHQLDFKKNQL